MLAHHLVQAVEYGRAAGLDVTALLPNAARALAGGRRPAWSLGEPSVALGFYERSRAVEPSFGDDPYLMLRIGRARVLIDGSGEAELERASAALAESDPATAAVAELLRGEIIWQRGEHDRAFQHFERARELDQGLPASPEKLIVVSQVARFLTLAGQWREGLELAEQAIAMADELGDQVWLSDALNTRGVARSYLGDPEWAGDLERASRSRSNSTPRGRTRLPQPRLDPRRQGRRPGQGRRRHPRGPGVRRTPRLGPVDSLVPRQSRRKHIPPRELGGGGRLAEMELADPEPHYIQTQCRSVRGYVRLARGDEAGALEDTEIALRDARAIRDPRPSFPPSAISPSSVRAPETPRPRQRHSRSSRSSTGSSMRRPRHFECRHGLRSSGARAGGGAARERRGARIAHSVARGRAGCGARRSRRCGRPAPRARRGDVRGARAPSGRSAARR